MADSADGSQTTGVPGEPGPGTVARQGRLIISLVFGIHGVVLASWAPHIPWVRDRHHLTDGQLGLVLLSVAAGAVAAMTGAGRIVPRVGLRRSTGILAVVHVLTLPLPVLAPNVPLVVVALALYGAVLGSLDVAMNAVAVEVEVDYGRPILSSVHGLYSVGSLVGAVAAAGLLRAGLTPRVHTLAMTAVLLAALVPTLRALPAVAAGTTGAPGPVSPAPASPGTPPEAGIGTGAGTGTGPDRAPVSPARQGHRSRTVWLVGAVALAALVGEGSVGDWSANLLRGDLGASPAFAALGLAAFSVAMAVGRLSGDRVRHRVGDATLMRGGAALAALGFAGGLLVARPWSVLVGYALLGLGYANLMPLLFSAGAAAADPPALGISTVAAVGYLGLLSGPPVIGFLAQAFSLSRALLLVAALAAVVALAAPHLTPGRAPRSAAGGQG